MGRKGSWMMGEWKRHGGGVVRSTNHPLLNFYNFCKYISFDVFSPSFFWHFEVHNWISYKLLTNFELTNFNQLPPSFSVLQFAMCDFGLTKTSFATAGNWCKRVFLVFFLVEAECCFWPNNVMTFLYQIVDVWDHFTTFQKICKLWEIQPIGFFVCWQITAVVEIELLTSILALTFGFE